MTTHPLPRPNHLSLGELIDRLNLEPPSKRLHIGFGTPCSYRGYYEELAFEITGPTTVGAMLDHALKANGAVFTGWKGGEYEMRRYTPVWLVAHPGDTGETLGAWLLEFLLAQEVTA